MRTRKRHGTDIDENDNDCPFETFVYTLCNCKYISLLYIINIS